MATEITMPKLSDTMTEGRLISWKKNIGEPVARGEIIAEVETDKATMELEAFATGVLTELRVKAGEMVAVGTVIGTIGSPEKKGEKPAPAAQIEEPSVSPPAPKTPEEPFTPSQAEAGLMIKPEKETSTEGDKASPLVRRMAREHGVDLRLVPASGPEGRILKEDLENYLRQGEEKIPREQAPAPEKPESQPKAGEGAPLSRMRVAIARTVTEAWHTIPHFYVTVSVEMGEAERVRQELQATGMKVSINDFIVKGAALALLRFSQVNACFAGDRIVTHDDINIGIAVALEEGLFVPVIRKCQKLTLRDIAAATRSVIDRVRAGKVSEAELSEGTFSISNLGVYGIEQFTAVIYPSHGAILAVGSVLDEAVIRGGVPVAARVMKATLSADHRLLDGAYAARFLGELKRVLENPVTLLL